MKGCKEIKRKSKGEDVAVVSIEGSKQQMQGAKTKTKGKKFQRQRDSNTVWNRGKFDVLGLFMYPEGMILIPSMGGRVPPSFSGACEASLETLRHDRDCDEKLQVSFVLRPNLVSTSDCTVVARRPEAY